MTVEIMNKALYEPLFLTQNFSFMQFCSVQSNTINIVYI
jgi:hypothetical protein